MSKQVQILLSRPLTVNLGTDENGQAKTHKLTAGLQQVDAEIADNWFVKAHCQEITGNDLQASELQDKLDKANEELSILQTQSDEATKKIGQLEGIVKERDTEIANLKIQLDKALQTQAAEVKAKEPAKAKEPPKET